MSSIGSPSRPVIDPQIDLVSGPDSSLGRTPAIPAGSVDSISLEECPPPSLPTTRHAREHQAARARGALHLPAPGEHRTAQALLADRGDDHRATEDGPLGSKVLSRLSADLRTEFPGAKGFSSANLKYMRRFAEAWPDQEAIGQRPVGQLPWGHVIELLEKLDDAELRDWYSAKDIAHGWSRPVLAHQIKTHLHLREGAAPSNFPHALERTDSELAQQITKDPFTLKFLAIDGDAAERQLEDRLVERIIDTLRELGPGFAFVGRQVHFDVEGDEFFVDYSDSRIIPRPGVERPLCACSLG
ncbi:PDDEXK nuclease domain-containing protein [Rhodococcus jostii]